MHHHLTMHHALLTSSWQSQSMFEIALSRLHGWARVRYATKFTRRSPFFSLFDSGGIPCNRAIASGRRQVQHILNDPLGKHRVSHILCAAFRHIPYQLASLRPATKR